MAETTMPDTIPEPPYWQTLLYRAMAVVGLAIIGVVALGILHISRAAERAASEQPVQVVAAPVGAFAVASPAPLAPTPSAGAGANTSAGASASAKANPSAGARTAVTAGGGTQRTKQQESGTATSGPTRVDPAWTARVSAATGIPARALSAYGAAQLVVDREDPRCGIGWNTIAAIGSIESNHGRHAGAVLGSDGYSTPAIRGPVLNGNGVAAIRDTDRGVWDGDTTWDRAVGPMQFIPSTWRQWGTDASGDGVADPNQIDDAALATARYLCSSGSMTTSGGWRQAIFAYNHLDAYVNDVAAAANEYARRAAQ